MKNFCSSCCLNSLIKQPTCFKNPENPSCNELILTNKTRCVIETGLSDFHRMIISALKMHFRKLPPKVISYWDFKNFENERFITFLQSTLESQKIDYIKNPDLIFEICQKVLNHHAPRKKKVEIINLL